MSRDEVHGREHLVARHVAMTAALTELGLVWPRKFAADHIPSLLGLWLESANGLDTDLLRPAARHIAKNAKSGTYPPAPGDLAEIGWALKKAREVLTEPAPAPHIPVIADDRDVDSVDRLYVLAAKHLRQHGHTGGLAKPIAQIWALLFEAQAGDVELEQLVRRGLVYDSVWLATVDAWRSGARAKANPMNNFSQVGVA